MTRHLTLAACQTGPVPRSASRAETVVRLIALLEGSVRAGAELVVFPEMALTTFFPRWEIAEEDEIDAFFEEAMPGRETQLLFDAARKLKVAFALGYSELTREDGAKRRFNTMDLVGPEGEDRWTLPEDARAGLRSDWLGRLHAASRATILPAGQSRLPGLRMSAGRGSGSRSVTTGAGPRPTGCCASMGPRSCSSATIRRRCSTRRPGRTICACSTTTCRCRRAPTRTRFWVAAAAKAGCEDGQALIGGSCVIAPTGEIAALATSIGDEPVTYRADLDLVAACRKVNFNFERYRRPDQYRAIAERAGP